MTCLSILSRPIYFLSLSAFTSLFLLFADCRPSAIGEPLTVHRPAEFEPTEAVWLLWSNYVHKRGFSNEQVTLDLVQALLPYVKVKLVLPSDSVLQRVKPLLPATALQSGQLVLYDLPYWEFWARDMGPSFVLDEKGQLNVTDFNFNAWGYAPPGDPVAALDEKLDERIAALLKVPLRSSDLITEGGDHEVNGQGTMLLTESVEKNRNPQWSLAQIEAEFRRMLGVKKVIWMHQGLREDDHTFAGPIRDKSGQPIYTVVTTNGHADEYVRFAAADLLLLAEADTASDDPLEQENARRLAENYRLLQAATNQNGRPFRIVRVPLPYPVIGMMAPGDGIYDFISTLDYEDGSPFPVGQPVQVIAAASYLNFLVANGCVLMPKYWKAELDVKIQARDEAVRAILQSAFPDKVIIPIDALAVNWGGGGIHCITMNEPKSSK